MNACSKCGLSLPNNYLTPVVMRNQSGQTKKGYLCASCKALIDSQRKPNPNIIPPKFDKVKEGGI
jgi:hypothetical protein